MSDNKNLWGLFFLRGVIALILGVLSIIAPGITMASLVILFGVYMLANGIFYMVNAINARRTFNDWALFGVYGIFALSTGIISLLNPFVAVVSLIYLFASWAFVAGVMEITVAVSLRKKIHGEGWYIMAGILNILLAIFFMLNPFAGVVTIALIFGSYSLVIGIMLISFSMRLKERSRPLDMLNPVIE